MKAFRDLPEEHIYSQAVWRFCQGCCDKEAGQNAAMSGPKSVEEDIDKIKWYQHTTKAIYGTPVRRREFSEDSDNEIESIRTINAAVKSERNFPTSKHQSDQLKSMEAQIQMLVENMQTLQTKLTSMDNKRRTRPQNTETRTCYNCDRPGHLAKDIVAVIDTGAEVTIISDKVYEMLQNKPPIKKHIVMHGAGRDMKMKTFIIEPIDIGIGTRTYSSEVYVAPMDDDMPLELDFMRRNHVQLDCCKQQIIINSDTFHMSYGKSKDTFLE